MTTVALIVFLVSLAIPLYAYVGYPLILKLIELFRGGTQVGHNGVEEWPSLSICLPAYNEEAVIADTLETLLEVDYPRDRLQVLVVSDASDDRTDEIVRGFADRGVELLRLPQRTGKTAAENAALSHVTGEIVVSTDASVRVDPAGLKSLITRFADPSVGVASGRDVSVGRSGRHGNVGESGYVGYEMWLRDLETRVGGIVGASGCYYAIRRSLHQVKLPASLSRDFAAALVAREHGFKAVSVNESVCYVPRVSSIRQEYHRKVRTITRGLETLAYKRTLLNPFKYGLFAWMLFSHKVCRWLVPWAGVSAVVALAVLAASSPFARSALAASGLGLILAGIGWIWPAGRSVPRLVSMPAYLVVGNLAALVAWIRALRGEMTAIWEPSRRDTGGPRLEHTA